MIRRRFIADVNRRFKWLKKQIVTAIVDNDGFGLGFNRDHPSLSPIKTQQSRRRQFAFSRSEDKIKAFMEWLNEMERRGILETITRSGTRQGIDSAWTDKYVRASYHKGMQKARGELRKAGAETPTLEQYPISAAFNQPFHVDRVGVLYTRAFNELKGIDDEMDRQISRVLAESMVQGLGAMEIARNINDRVDKIGITRARVLARTETIRAHHVATIAEYRQYGVDGVRVKAEWLTAGFNVCPVCQALEGKVFTLDEIEGMIPRHPNCLLDGQVKVYAAKGWKKIKDVIVGDFVLTHKGRFKKVVQIHHTRKQTPNAVQIKFGGTQQMKLSLTDNHPVLIGKRWVEAKEIKVGDEIYYLADDCKRCKKPTPYFNKYCSHTCQSKDVTDKQWSCPEHRKNISKKARKQLLKQYKLGIRDKDKITRNANKKVRELSKRGKLILQKPETREIIRQCTNTPEQRKKSSDRMKIDNPMFDEETKKRSVLKMKKFLKDNPDRHPSVIMAKKGFVSSIEKKMKVLLDRLDIPYVQQYSIKSYYVDFAIPALRIVIECDGLYWHEKNRKKDRKRQKEIEKEGWFVLRFTDHQINKCFGEVKDEVLRIVGNHKGKYHFIKRRIVEVKKWEVTHPRTLYNLSVKGDESYIANGFVVHNCRCAAIPAEVEVEEKE